VPSPDIRNIFGITMAVAYTRTLPYSASMTNKVLQAIASGFGLSTTDGDAIFSYFNTEAHPETTSGFTDTPYTTYEAEVSNILSSYSSRLSANQLAILTIVAHAMIFAYAMNPSINLTDFQNLMGSVLAAVSSSALENQIFESTEGIYYTPFSSRTVLRNLLQNDYSQTIQAMSSSAKNVEVPLTNYNWYDANQIFHGPDLQIMKDVENQYYYLTGELIYQSAFGSVEPCIEDITTINTWTGSSTFTYYRNTPCRQADTYIGPPNTITFNRVFNDGPSSSGYFTSGLSGFYTRNDKAMLDRRAYLTNSHSLYTYSGSSLASDTVTDANGEYSFPRGDYLNAPYSFGCDEPYQRLHIGDNRPRYICNSNTCVCVLTNVTGFKFAVLSLPDDDSTNDWQFRQTNPLSDDARILQRALNINDNPYRATDIGGVLYPYVADPSAPFTQRWTVGYPVLSGGNKLPEVAFFQTFDSPTFGDSPSLVLFPSIGTSVGSVGENLDSDRSFTIGSRYLFSGGGSLPVKFVQKISSNLSGYDRTTQQFFGMGTAFSGVYNLNVTAEENAGFFYSGFTVYQNGIPINASTLADSFLSSTLGNRYSTAKYVSGYRRLADGVVHNLTNFFAKDSTGNLYTYGYISQDDVPAQVISQDNWSYFAQAPSALEDTSIYERLYGDQTPENYLPRFYDGPFSKETRTFLYPNAKILDSVYGGKNRGIPTRVRFKINIREEAVKEIFGRYTIYPDGTITEQPEIVHAVRSDTVNGRTKNPKMRNMFIPDTSEDNYDYNFNYWGTGQALSTNAGLPSLVDKNWAPYLVTGTSAYVISGRNANEYVGAVNAHSVFNLGLKSQSDSHQTHALFGPTGLIREYYSPKMVIDALFHDFEFTSLSGVLVYALPIFDLQTNTMSTNQGMNEGFATTLNNLGLNYVSFNGRTSGFDSGRDPLFLQHVGGRRGGKQAIAEGGYHSHDIIGDRWVGMVYQNFGSILNSCNIGGNTNYYVYRYPQLDEKLVLFNTDASGTDIWINGMSFAPYRMERDKRPLTLGMQYPYSKDGSSGFLTVAQSGEFITFNLGQFFPIKGRTGIAGETQWYYQSGLRVGPFDRDIEIGLTDGEVIASYSEFYINGQQLSHWFTEADNCDKDWVQNVSIAPYIKPGEPFYSYARNQGYTILSVIPSGTCANINILSNLSDGVAGNPAMDYIGMPTGAIVTLKTHVPLDANGYDSLLYSGEEGRLESNGYLDNGIPFKYRLSHDSLENLARTWEFVNIGYSGKLYPKPDETAYAALAITDAYGNVVYPTGVNPETYWRSVAIHSGVPVYFSGYREGSRISFEIYDVQLDFDRPPYQSFSQVAPSGDCTLSGEMGYYAQADNCIFTEGVYLTNTTFNDTFTSTYNPSYVSDVLIRMPSGYFTFPITQSGSGHAPVLVAPSVMKQREYISGIEDGQSYSYLFRFPTNNYNKLLWPALSDLEILNPGETLETIPPGDGDTFSNSTMIFSACQGQKLPNGLANPIINKTYTVQNIFQLYDSTTTDALINSGKCITSGRGEAVQLSQNGNLSGALVPRGTALGLVLKGLV
jgi:hypothetical protein